jgi:F-type H+-transporting ATPase subunit delta
VSDANTLARPYAKAAFEYALEHKQLHPWKDMLQCMALIVLDPLCQKVLHDPTVTNTQALAMILEVGGERFNQEGQNYLRVLASYHRLLVLPFIYQQYEQLMDEHLKVVDVSVISAFPLPAALSEKLKQVLEKKYQCNIELSVTVDSSVIGGALIKLGDKVIDGTVLGKLQSLQNHLINAKETLCQSAQ